MSGQPVSQSASCTLALSSGLDIEEGSTALPLPLLLSLLYMCVCVRGSLMKWNARIGLPPGRASPSYNVSQPAALWDRGEAASIKRRASGGPGVIQREGRFFFFNHSSLLWREGIVVTPHIHPFLKIWGPLLPRPPTLFLFFTPSFF